MQPNGAQVELRGVAVRRGGRAVVDEASLAVAPGELVVLIGPSGAGKSTLLGTINRLVEPDAGEIRIDQRDVRTLPPETLRRGIGYCFQGLGLFPHLSVADNIGVTPRLLGWDAARIAERVDELLARVGLDPALRRRLPAELSGGQAQRVAVARALAAAPPLLLLDEPFGALDPETRARLQKELAALQRTLGVTTLLVSHDLGEALLLATRLVVMIDGRIVQVGAAAEILSRPASPEVAALIEPARARARALAALGGEG
jgi:osmoprotectant transport system ATP-binding protein